MDTELSAAEERYFSPDPNARAIYVQIVSTLNEVGMVKRRASKSQIRFYRKHLFAAVWRPRRYLSGSRPSLVLSVFLRRRDGSARWKEVVEPAAGRFTHHLELNGAAQVDEEVQTWLAEAWASAA